MGQIATIGLDIAKSVFQVHGVDSDGVTVLHRRLTQARLLEFFSKIDRCRIGIEACAASHHWAREPRAFGHDVRLMPSSYVKPYVKRQKNDAICAAVMRPTMRFVELKTPDRQSTLILHRTRAILMRQRIQLSNAIRGHMAEFGIVAPIGAMAWRGCWRSFVMRPTSGCPPRRGGIVIRIGPLHAQPKGSRCRQEVLNQLEWFRVRERRLREGRFCESVDLTMSLPRISPMNHCTAPHSHRFRYSSQQLISSDRGRSWRTQRVNWSIVLSSSISTAASSWSSVARGSPPMRDCWLLPRGSARPIRVTLEEAV